MATSPKRPRPIGPPFKKTRGGIVILGRSPISGQKVLASPVVSVEQVMRDLETLRIAREAERDAET